MGERDFAFPGGTVAFWEQVFLPFGAWMAYSGGVRDLKVFISLMEQDFPAAGRQYGFGYRKETTGTA